MAFTKKNIVETLQRRGVSRRLARKLLDGMISAMKDGLQRGEDIELPFGTLQVVKQNRPPKRDWLLRRITTTYKYPFTVILNPPQQD